MEVFGQICKREKYMEVQWEYVDWTLIPTPGAGIHFMAQLAIWNTEMLQRF